MAIYEVEKDSSGTPTGTKLVAGGTLYADSPIGTILPYGGASAPSGWFLCKGQALSRTTYSELFAVIGTSFGVGDGSTTFNLPDMRETVPVGIGTRGWGVTDHDVYTLGEFKDDQLQDHRHADTPCINVAKGEYSTAFSYDAPEGYGRAVEVGRRGTTTHGKQLGVNYIIKAKMVGVPADFMSAVDEAVSDAITVKKGTWTGSIVLQKMGDTQTRDRFDIPITFDTPMPDNNYTVVIEFYESRYVTIRSASKTASGFHIEGANADNVAASNLTKITWTAIRFPS